MKTAAILIARLIFAGIFAMSALFKFTLIGIDATAAEIAAAGFPFPLLLAWVAAFFEVALAIGFLTGFYFSEVAIVAAAYILFLAFSFHGPGKFAGNPMEFGFFVDHFTFIAGLLFAASMGLAALSFWPPNHHGGRNDQQTHHLPVVRQRRGPQSRRILLVHFSRQPRGAGASCRDRLSRRDRGRRVDG